MRVAQRRQLRLIGLVLLPIGCSAAVLGFVDALGASLIEYRLVGVMLLAVGALLIVGTAGLFVGGRRGRAFALVASVVAPLVGLNMLLAQLGAREYDARVALWLLLLAAPVPPMVTLWRAGVRTTLPRQVVGVVSAGLLLSVIQFWYTAQYVPSSISPSLTITLGLEKVGENQQELALAATISVKNASATRVRIVGSMYRFSAVRKCFTTEISDERGFASELTKAQSEGRPASRVAQDRTVDVLMAGPEILIAEGGWFDPGQEATRRFTVYVPRTNYDLARLETIFFFGKGSQLDLDVVHGFGFGPRDGTQNGLRYIEAGWRLRHPSLLASLTRDEFALGGLVVGAKRVLVSRWFVSGDGSGLVPFPYLIVYLDREGRASIDPPRDDYNVGLENLYGLAFAPSITELSLWPATVPIVLPSQAASTAPTPSPPTPPSPIGRGGGCP